MSGITNVSKSPEVFVGILKSLVASFSGIILTKPLSEIMLKPFTWSGEEGQRDLVVGHLISVGHFYIVIEFVYYLHQALLDHRSNHLVVLKHVKVLDALTMSEFDDVPHHS